MGIQIMAKYKYNKEFFYTESPELYYFLGYFMSDGHITKNKMILSFGLSNVDRCVLEKFCKWICPDLKIGYYEHIRPSGYICKICYISICNKEIVNFLLERYKINQQKTFNPVIPFNMNPIYYGDFIRGVFDGDGCIVIDDAHLRGKVSIASMSFVYLQKIRDIIGAGYIDKTGRIPLLYFTSENDISIFENFIYKDNSFCLERKRKKFIYRKRGAFKARLLDWEKRFILENKSLLKLSQLMKILNRSDETIKSVGMKTGNVKIRNNDSLSMLRISNYNIKSEEAEFLADYFNVGIDKIHRTFNYNGYQISKTYSIYSREDEEYIKKTFNPNNRKASLKIIADKLNKPIRGIYHKCLRLGLVHNKKKISSETIEYIKENIDLPNKKLIEKTGLSNTTIKRCKKNIKVGKV